MFKFNKAIKPQCSHFFNTWFCLIFKEINMKNRLNHQSFESKSNANLKSNPPPSLNTKIITSKINKNKKEADLLITFKNIFIKQKSNSLFKGKFFFSYIKKLFRIFHKNQF
jgi:hypothetical protein